jgi:TPR repeat protein
MTSFFMNMDDLKMLAAMEIPLDDAVNVGYADRIIEPLTVADLLAPSEDGTIFAEAWKIFLARRHLPDEENWDRAVLLLLYVFRSAFRRGLSWERSLQSSLSLLTTKSGRPMSLSGSYFEAMRQGASRQFHYGRRGKLSGAKVAALEASIRDFDFLLVADAAGRNASVRRRYLGMRGVASMFLARSLSRPELFERATSDLEETGVLGDVSSQHSEYLAEAYLHRYEGSANLEMLVAAQKTISEARNRGLRTRALASISGSISLAFGIRDLENDRADEAALQFEAAVAALDEALDLPPRQSHSESYIRINRGAARVRWSYSLVDAAREEALLGEAIDDLRQVEIEGGEEFLNLWLPGALEGRARLLQKRGDLSSSLRDAAEAHTRAVAAGTTPGAEALANRAELRVADVELAIAVAEHDEKRTIDLIAWWLTNPVPPDRVPVATIGNAMRFLIGAHVSDWGQYVVPVVTLFRQSAEHPTLAPLARRFALGHAATLTLMLAKSTDDIQQYRDAYSLYIDALDATDEPAAAELYGHAGEVALKLAKAEIAKHHDSTSILLLQDAAAFMERAFERHTSGAMFSEKTPVVAVHSRAGEVYMRLHGFTGNDTDAAQAIRHLTTARELGNSSPQLCGLLADVYFRRGRSGRVVDDLRTAIALKREARTVDAASNVMRWRENFSVTANAALQIWTITRSLDDLADAIKAAADAAREDPNWAWPVLQLADAARASTSDLDSIRAMLSADMSEPLVRLAVEGDVDELTRRACHIAVENGAGFSRDENFSGRSTVYTIDDPHRLLSTTLIVKEMQRENAEREMMTINSFREYLTTTNAPSWMRLPEPLALIEAAGGTAYVMRREAGAELGAIVLRRQRVGIDAMPLLIRTIRFLAHFHAWRGVDAATDASVALADPIRKSVRRLVDFCGRGRESSHDLLKPLRLATGIRLLRVAKKDAHAENWLVTPRDEVVMIDLETKESSRLPILYEVAQFIEDQGLITADTTGWNKRISIVDLYLKELSGLSGLEELDTPPEAFEQAYAVLALLRAVISIPSVDIRSIRRRTESSVVGARTYRADHYRTLVNTIQVRFADTPVGDAAAIVAGWFKIR